MTGIRVGGYFQGQAIVAGLNQINASLLKVNAQMRTQGALTRTLLRGHQQATTATKTHASSMKTLALRFVGYNLVVNAILGAQQKLIQLIGESVQKYREFETRLAEISTILQDDTDQMERFKVGIESLSKSYGQSTSDISKGLYDILSAAFDSRDAMNLLNTSIKASIAGLSDVRTSVDIFTTVLNSYGMAAEQATHVSDVLFQSVVRGKFQFADLEQALGYVVPIAAQAGISFDELSAALSTATRHGLHIDMTARGLALAIQNIINPSAQATKAAEKYGIEMNGLALRIMGLKGWFDELRLATDKFGRSVLGELIPNMRSLRVAMVLAGEEGAKGFAEDLMYLDNIAGRTGEALEKIQDTSAFTAKQLEQEMEERLRNAGEAWDEFDLSVREAIIGIADNWQYAIPIFGSLLQFYDNFKKQEEAGAAQSIFDRFKFDDTDISKAKSYMSAMLQMEELSKKMEDMEGRDYELAVIKMEALQKVTEQTVDSYNSFVGEIQNVQQELGDLEIDLDEVSTSIVELNRALVDNITVGWGEYQKTVQGTLGLELAQLKYEQQEKDIQHDVKMGLVDSTYAWKTNNAALKEAVDFVRQHEAAQKSDREATERMSIAMRQLQIAMLEIQLAGMMRRRGLTRNEEKRMKALQIEQAKLRLENMKNTKQETVETFDAYNEKKAYIDEFLAKVSEESYQLKYTYDNQILELENHINIEKEKLDTRYGWWATTNQKIINNSKNLVKQLGAIMDDPELLAAFSAFDIDIAGMMSAAITRQNTAEAGFTIPGLANISQQLSVLSEMQAMGAPVPEGMLRSLRGMQGVLMKQQGIPEYKRGIEHVPATMAAIVHRDETILPAGRTIDSGTVIQQVTINVKEIADINSVEKLGAALGVVRQANVSDRMGRTKYRL